MPSRGEMLLKSDRPLWVSYRRPKLRPRLRSSLESSCAKNPYRPIETEEERGSGVCVKSDGRLLIKSLIEEKVNVPVWFTLDSSFAECLSKIAPNLIA